MYCDECVSGGYKLRIHLKVKCQGPAMNGRVKCFVETVSGVDLA